MSVKPIPDHYHTVTPYLTIDGVADAIEFYKKAFGATETMRLPGPDGKIGHAEIKIGDSPIMMSDEFPKMGGRSPKSLGGSPITIMLYVEDVDAVVAKAVEVGATLIRPVADQFYGDRSGGVTDPFGHIWYIATHKEDVGPEEIQHRMQAMMNKTGCNET